jgi:aspartyl-tRNA(Asn)/glutamyl-tRNA(Gln) amidotransferase subunit C
MIKKEEVEHIAKLARLELTENEIKKLQKDMSAILDYFDLLKKAPKIEVKTDFSKTISDQRQDIALQGNLADEEVLVAAAPDKKDGYIKVKSILN